MIVKVKLLTFEQVDKLIDYLAEKPYSEVRDLIDSLNAAPVADAETRPAIPAANDVTSPEPAKPATTTDAGQPAA